MIPTFSRHSLQYFFLKLLPSRSLAMTPLSRSAPNESGLEQISATRAGFGIGRPALEEMHHLAADLQP